MCAAMQSYGCRTHFAIFIILKHGTHNYFCISFYILESGCVSHMVCINLSLHVSASHNWRSDLTIIISESDHNFQCQLHCCNIKTNKVVIGPAGIWVMVGVGYIRARDSAECACVSVAYS